VRHIHIIGIGTGNPEHLTVQAINAMNAADVVFIPTKGAAKADLAEVRREICERYLTREGVRIVEFEVPKRGPGPKLCPKRRRLAYGDRPYL